MGKERQHVERSPSPEIFPKHEDGIWDLDAFAMEGATEKYQDPLPQWVRDLTEAEANRLYAQIDDISYEDLVYFLGHSQNPPERGQLIAIARDLDRKTIKSHLRAWLERHGLHGFTQTQGTYLKKPGLLRVKEQKLLVKPNLRQIFSQHFAGYPLPAGDRTLLDVGTWDGEYPTYFRDIFRNAIGIEPNEKRFDQIAHQASANFQLINAEIGTIMHDRDEHSIRADAALFSHVLYFLNQMDEEDFEALTWCMKNVLHEQGMAAIVLNDTAETPGSRAHMRRAFGVPSTTITPERYKTFLESKGYPVRIMRPSLTMTAHTPAGQQALQDILRFSLPGETRHNHALLKRYQDYLWNECNGTYRHTDAIIAVYRDPSTAPMARTECHAAPHSLVSHTRATLGQALPASQPHAKSDNRHAEIAALEPVGTRINTMTAREKLDLIDLIFELSDGGFDARLRPVLERAELEWWQFSMLRESRDDLELMAQFDETGKVPAHPRMSPSVRRYILQAIAAKAGGNRQKLHEALDEAGLDRATYYRWRNAEEKPRGEEREAEPPRPVAVPVAAEEEPLVEDPDEIMEAAPKPPTPAPAPELPLEYELLAMRQELLTLLARDPGTENLPNVHAFLNHRAALLQRLARVASA